MQIQILYSNKMKEHCYDKAIQKKFYALVSGTLDSAIKSNPITGLDRPRVFQEVEVPRFQDNRHMKVERLSAIRTGRLYPPRNTPGTHFC